MGSTRESGATPADRLLDAAGTLFPQEGIRAVGVDRVLAEAGVARASLYQSFGSKDALIAAYVDRQDLRDQEAWEKAAASCDDAADKIGVLFDLARATAQRRRFRGCLYLNAATEFPDQQHPVVASVARHRTWLRELLAALVTELAIVDVPGVVQHVQVIYDGAVAGSKFARSTEPIDTGKEMAMRVLRQAERREG